MIITYSQMHHTDKYSQHSSIIWPVSLNGWLFVYELIDCGFESRCTCFEQEFLDTKATSECRFTLKCVRDMTLTYSQVA